MSGLGMKENMKEHRTRQTKKKNEEMKCQN